MHFRIQEHVHNSMDHFETTCIMLAFQLAWKVIYHQGAAVIVTEELPIDQIIIKGYKREEFSIVTLVPNYGYSLHGPLCYYSRLLRPHQLLLSHSLWYDQKPSKGARCYERIWNFSTAWGQFRDQVSSSMTWLQHGTILQTQLV